MWCVGAAKTTLRPCLVCMVPDNDNATNPYISRGRDLNYTGRSVLAPPLHTTACQRGAALDQEPGVRSHLFFRARISPESWSRRARREFCCSRSSATLASTRLSSRQTFSSSLSRRPLDLPAVMTPRASLPPSSPFGLADIFRSEDRKVLGPGSWVLGGVARVQTSTALV